MDSSKQNRIDEETEKRISAMEKSDYVFPQRFSKNDYIITVAVIIVCLAAVIAGAYIQ